MNFQASKKSKVPSGLKVIRPEKRTFEMLTSPTHFEHYLHNAYENYSADIILNMLPQNSILVDVGAHHGFYTLLAATKSESIKVIAFEPAPENFEILKKNSELNKLSNVQLHSVALSDENGERAFEVSRVSSRSGFYHTPLTETIQTLKVPTARLDDFFRALPHVPVFVKIDVEGHEIAVLEGMTRILTRLEDLRLLVEFNPDCQESAGHDPEALLRKLNELGFDIYFIEDARREVYKIPENRLGSWRDYFDGGNFRKNYFNLLCVRKSRSLAVTFFSHTADLGGAERSLLELVRELIEDNGVVCSVILPSEGPFKSKLDDIGASTRIIDYAWWCDFTSQGIEEQKKKLKRSFTNILGYINALSRLNPDAIITNTLVIPWGAVTAQILDKPHVWFVREFGVVDHGLQFFEPFDYILDFIRETSSHILTNSIAVRKILFGDRHNLNISTIYNHIDIPQNSLSQDAAKHFGNASAVKLIVLGSLTGSKGQLDAILAVKELVQRRKTVELIVMGRLVNHPYLDRLRSTVEQENLQAFVKFVDFQENHYPLIDEADIILVCSRNEAFGRVALEAMTLKKPVIGTRTGGTPELIKDGCNGFLYDPGNYKELAAKIEYLIDHKRKRTDLGRNGYKIATRRFTRSEYGGRVHRLLFQLKGKPNPLTSAWIHFMNDLYLTPELDPLSMLLHIYWRRGDLQNAFPEVKSGDYERLIEWADKVVMTRSKDTHLGNLLVYSDWFSKNAWTRTRNDRIMLESITSSFSYRTIRSFTSKVDSLFPDGTRRGELRKRVTAVLRSKTPGTHYKK